MPIYKFINPDDIHVENMSPDKQYTTRVVECTWDKNSNLVIELEYLGEEYAKNSPQCLFPLKKN